MQINGYEFAGPYTNTGALIDSGGVYVLLDYRSDGRWHVVDVGESGQVKTRIECHDRGPSWARVRQGTLGVAVLYTSGWTAEQRRALEWTIRNEYQPVCGQM